MCGIAGYNLRKEFVDQFITPEVQTSLIKEAWFHNIHRGEDAAGFMGWTNESQELLIYKSAGRADKIFKEDFEGKGIEVLRSFAAHTRLPSFGAAVKSNDSNHPVGWDRCWVVHNGTLNNDDYLIHRFAHVDRWDDLPEVDTVAFPVIMADADLSSTDDLITRLQRFAGSFAINMMWEEKPNVSLFARGNSSPYILAFNPEIGMFFGSEEDSIVGMINALGLDWKDMFEWRSLDMGAFILMENGVPVDWDGFKANVSSSHPQPIVKTRWLPKEGRRPALKVYETNKSGDYLFKAKTPSLVDDLEEEGVLIYTRKDGFVDPRDGEFPFLKGELELYAVTAEADSVWEHRSADLYSVFIGQVEIVMTSSRIIRDIFDHSTFSNEERFEERPVTLVEPKPESLNIPFNEFWSYKKTTKKVPPLNVASYKYLSSSKSSATDYSHGGGGWGKAKQLPITSASTTKDAQKTFLAGLDDEEIAEIKTKSYFGWQESWDPDVICIYDEQYGVKEHKSAKLIFKNDGLCGTHGQVRYTEHPNPLECRTVMRSVMGTIAAFADLEMWFAFDLGAELRLPNVNGVTKEVREACVGSGGHFYADTKVRKCFVFRKYYYLIPFEQVCVWCNSVLRLEKVPAWFEDDRVFTWGPMEDVEIKGVADVELRPPSNGQAVVEGA